MIQLKKISEIKANPNNPRVIKDDKFKKLVASIKEFPKMLELRPIVCNADGVVLGGNMRLKACKEVGLKEVPVIYAHELSDDQQREFIVKDNVGFGEWDWEMIANQWDAEELENWGLDIPDFAVKHLDAEDDDFEIPEEVKTDIVLGDLFEIGEHKLLCGSSIEIDQYAKLLKDEFIDLVVTDPPYNVAYEGKTKDALTIENDSMKNDDFYRFLYDFYVSIYAYMKKGAPFYVWFADVEIVNFSKSLVDSGLKLAQMIIWKKNSLVMGRKDYHFMHEPCLYGWKEGETHKWYSDRKQTTILEFDRPSRNAEHPTMKPIPLISYQIENSSKVKDLIFDGFLGSGTTMVAAHQLKRKCYGMELDPKYCQVIIDRMKKLDPTIKIKRNGNPYGN